MQTFSVREYAAYLVVAPARVREWIRQGDLAAIEVGGRHSSLRITPAAAREFEESRRVRPAVEPPSALKRPVHPRVAAMLAGV